MSKKRGMSLVELVVAIGLMAMTIFSVASMFIFGLRAMHKTTTDTNLNQTNAQGMRRVAETLRGAMSFTISTDGRSVAYVLPKVSTVADPYTGEKEYQIPLVSDGVTRSFYVTTSGNLIDQATGRTLVRNIRMTDPDPNSTQYNQNYPMFSVATVGSQRAVSINLITAENVLGKLRYSRLKTTVMAHNR